MVTLLDLYKNDIESIIKIGKKDILPIISSNQFNIVLNILFNNVKKSIKIFDDNLAYHSLESYKALKNAYKNNSNLLSEIYLKYNCVSSRVRDEFLSNGTHIICNLNDILISKNIFIPFMILIDNKFLIIKNNNYNNKKFIAYDDMAIDNANKHFEYIKSIINIKS